MNFTLGNIGQHVYLLINDYPEFFIKVVDDWVQYVKEEQLRDDARFGTIYRGRPGPQAQIGARVKFEFMVKAALKDARSAVDDLSLAERKWFLYDEAGQRKAECNWAISHEEISDEDSDGRSNEWGLC
jgi:hypothetical protein